MCAVTERLLAAVLAAAEKHPLACLGCVFDRCNARVLVTAIAERLLAALATSAPEVGFAFFNFDGVRSFLRDDRCCHEFALVRLNDDLRSRASSAVYNALLPNRGNSGAERQLGCRWCAANWHRARLLPSAKLAR